MEKEIGVIKKEKSKLRHILGIEHGNIPIQLDLWGNEVIFRGKRTTNAIRLSKIVMPCGLIPGLFRLSSLPFGYSCDVFGSRLRSPISFRLKAYCHASIPLP